MITYACIHTYIQTYIHTYKHTYKTHTQTDVCGFPESTIFLSTCPLPMVCVSVARSRPDSRPRSARPVPRGGGGPFTHRRHDDSTSHRLLRLTGDGDGDDEEREEEEEERARRVLHAVRILTQSNSAAAQPLTHISG